MSARGIFATTVAFANRVACVVWLLAMARE